MPFGICSSKEVFQRRLIEGLHGMEVVADDFAAVGFGETLKEATLKNLKAFLERQTERREVVREVPFIGPSVIRV